jgi:hypothetical protein
VPSATVAASEDGISASIVRAASLTGTIVVAAPKPWRLV